MSPVNNMKTLLTSLVERTEGETVSIENLLNAVGRRAYGPLLLLLGFIAISPLTIVPGASWLIAFITLLIAGQIVIGRKLPWLPRKVLDAAFPRKILVQGVEAMRRPAFVMDKFVCPRLTFLTETPFVQMVAVACIVAALITFPLGFVPFGPLLPGITIMLIGLGLTSRDGMILILASSSLVGAFFVLYSLFARGLSAAISI